MLSHVYATRSTIFFDFYQLLCFVTSCVATFLHSSRHAGLKSGVVLTRICSFVSLQACRLEIWSGSDTPSFFTADPHMVPQAVPIPTADYDTALEMVSSTDQLYSLYAYYAWLCVCG